MHLRQAPERTINRGFVKGNMCLLPENRFTHTKSGQMMI